MVDVTLDSIIRKNLAKKKLPLHFYSPLLVIAKDGLREMHFDALQKVKTVVLDVDPVLKTAVLPEDFVEDVFIGFETGDKLRPIGYNHRINTRDDEGMPFPVGPELYVNDAGAFVGGVILNSHFNEYSEFEGKYFGRPVTFTDSYAVLRDLGLIRVDNKSDITKIQLVYLSLPEKISNKSVIHPFASKALEDFMNWQWEVYNKGKDQEIRRRDYFLSYRVFRARKNKMTTTEIKRIFRNKYKLSIKN